MNTFFNKYGLLLIWIQAFLAIIGSLFFSLVMNLPPCDLCWYQRIAMYPLVIIFGIDILRNQRTGLVYAFPLVVIGWIIALYHNLLYYKIISDTLAPCVSGVSCTTKYIEWFGFVTIPLLSFVSFTFILGVLLVLKKNK